jgi:hypothetical protein
MAEGGHGASLQLESAEAIWVASQRFGENFDGYFAAQASVAGAIHLAHAARADGSEDFVRPQFCASGKRHLKLPRKIQSRKL